MLLVFNILFYVLNAGSHTCILVAAVAINYALSGYVSEKKKAAYIISNIINISLLVSFKVFSSISATSAFGFLNEEASAGLKILLPLGISFYSFKLISYQTDLFRGDISKASFIDMASYVTDFSQILSGPIGRFDDMKTEGKALSNISDGLTYFCAGLFIKIVIADNLSRMWNQIGTIGYENISVPLAWAGVFIFSAELFADFWGYSLMASGIGVMLGRKFIRNFDEPYKARGVTEFYRRWHMTLGSFFKDYVYIPMGGSRVKVSRMIFNLFIVWLLTGLWHGVTLNFLIWAAILFVLIVIEKCVLSKNEKIYSFVSRINVIVLIPLSWIVFALTDMTDLKNYVMRLSGLRIPTSVIDAGDLYHILSTGWIYIILAVICFIPGIRKLFDEKRRSPAFAVILFGMFWISIYGIVVNSSNPFMYMGF